MLCLFVLFVCCVFFLKSFMSDCCMTEFVDLQNDMYVCIYIYMYAIFCQFNLDGLMTDLHAILRSF